MKQIMIILAVMATIGGAAVGDTSTFMADVSKAAEGAIGIVEFKVKTDLDQQERIIVGMGVCIKSDGYLLVSGVDVRPEFVREVSVIVPGMERKRLTAKLLGSDLTTRLTFVQTTQPHNWRAVQFARRANVTPGMQVVSAAVLAGYKTCVSTAYVSAEIELPERLVYVTGGHLTMIGSPVFASNGKVIGLVRRQMESVQQMDATGQGRFIRVAVRGSDSTNWFTPVDEFIHVLSNIPSAGAARRPGWIGAMLEVVDETTAKYKGLESPGIQIVRIVPNHAADKAGLMKDDIIIALNGKSFKSMASFRMVVGEFQSQIARMSIDQKVDLTYLRTVDGSSVEQTTTLSIEAMMKMPGEALKIALLRLGFVAREKVAIERLLGEGPTSKLSGLPVINVAKNSPAELAGLQRGDLITAANNQMIETTAQLRSVVDRALGGGGAAAPVNLMINRGGQTPVISITPSTNTGR